MTSLNVGLSGSGSCGEHERRWSSNSLISLAPDIPLSRLMQETPANRLLPKWRIDESQKGRLAPRADEECEAFRS